MQVSRSCRGELYDLDVTVFSNSPRAGISFKTQALYATVFITRYLDLFTSWVSLYNFIMKIFFIGSSCYILFLMRTKFRYAHPSISFGEQPETYHFCVDQPTTLQSIRSRSSTWQDLRSLHPSSSTTISPRWRSSGPSPYSSRQSPFSPSCSCSNGQAKLTRSTPTTWLR